MSTFEMGANFSQSEEHRSLIVKVGAAAGWCFLMSKGVMFLCNTQLGQWQVVTCGALKAYRREYRTSWIHISEISSETKVVADLLQGKATNDEENVFFNRYVPDKQMMSGALV